MTVKEYSPLWLRDSNACDTCTPKIIDINHSNYYIEEDTSLYIVYGGEKLKLVKTDSALTSNVSYFEVNDGLLVTTDEKGNVEEIEIVYGCSYQFGYLTETDGDDVDSGILGTILFISVESDSCKINDFILTKYFIDCETDEWVYIFNGALNRLPSNLADEATGILPNGQSKRYFARIEKKHELRVKQMSETDLDIIEYILNQPQISLTTSDKIYNISEGSIFTFDFDNYGLFYGICEVVESTMIVQKCCEVLGS